jgi:hypothetical protein
MKRLLPLLLCLPILLIGHGQEVSNSGSESVADILIVQIDPSTPSEQVLEIDGRYRLEIRDESGDQHPDHWDLYVDGILRCRRWSYRGYGPPSTGEVYDAEGNLIRKLVTKY